MATEKSEEEKGLDVLADYAKKKSEAMKQMGEMVKKGDKKNFEKYIKNNMKFKEPFDVLYLGSFYDLYLFSSQMLSYWASLFGFLERHQEMTKANLRAMGAIVNVLAKSAEDKKKLKEVQDNYEKLSNDFDVVVTRYGQGMHDMTEMSRHKQTLEYIEKFLERASKTTKK